MARRCTPRDDLACGSGGVVRPCARLAGRPVSSPAGRDLIDSLYAPDWKMWLGDTKDGKRDGGPHDPRIALIFVEADSVTYSKKDRPTPMVLFELLKGRITGEPPKVADLRELRKQELRNAIEG